MEPIDSTAMALSSSSPSPTVETQKTTGSRAHNSVTITSFQAKDGQKSVLEELLQNSSIRKGEHAIGDSIAMGTIHHGSYDRSCFVRSFDLLVFVMIFLNVAQLGFCVLCNDLEKDTDTCTFPEFCNTSEIIFVAVFVSEAAYKIYCCGRSYWFDPWNIFDFALAALGVLGSWILPFVNTHLDGMKTTGILGTLRVLKLFRILRVLKLMRMFKNLRMILEGLLKALGGMIWIGALLLLLVYCSAVFGVVLFRNVKMDDDVPYNFHSLGEAMWAMYAVAIAAEWTDIVQPVAEYYWWGSHFFTAYCFIATLGILNLIIGVITERTAVVQRHYEKHAQEILKADRFHNLRKLTDVMFLDTKHLSPAEMTEFFHDVLPTLGDHMSNLVMDLELPQGWHIDDCHEIFDRNCSGNVSRTEFEDGMCALMNSSDGPGILMLQKSIASIAQTVRRLDSSIAELKQRLPEKKQPLHSDGKAAATQPRAESPQRQPGALLSANGAAAATHQFGGSYLEVEGSLTTHPQAQDCLWREQLVQRYAAAIACAEAAVGELRSAEHLTFYSELMGREEATSVGPPSDTRVMRTQVSGAVEAGDGGSASAQQGTTWRQVPPSAADGDGGLDTAGDLSDVGVLVPCSVADDDGGFDSAQSSKGFLLSRAGLSDLGARRQQRVSEAL